MKEYLRELGYTDEEIEKLLHPVYAPVEVPRIDPKWYEEIRGMAEKEIIPAIIVFREKFDLDLGPLPSAWEDFGPEAVEAARREHSEAVEEQKEYAWQAQAPVVDALERTGVEIASQYWAINAASVRIPVGSIDAVLSIDDIAHIEAMGEERDADISNTLDAAFLPYKTLLDNARMLGINQHHLAGYTGIGTGSDGSYTGRIIIGINERAKFDDEHRAFRDGSGAFSRVRYKYGCDFPLSPYCVAGLPESISCSGNVPQHAMWSTGVAAADLTDGQDSGVPSGIRAHYSGAAPEALIAMMHSSEKDHNIHAFEKVIELGLDIYSRSRVSTANGACPNEEQWGANDALSAIANTAAEAGVIVVNAAGNANQSGEEWEEDECPDEAPQNSIGSPGNSPYVVTVGAIEYIDHPRTAATTDTLWNPQRFRDVSLITGYSSRGVTQQGHRKPNIASYVGMVHTPQVDRDGANPVEHNRYADTNWWLDGLTCDSEPNNNWWVRAPNRYTPPQTGFCLPDPDNFDNHACDHGLGDWQDASVYYEKFSGTSAATPAVAGVFAVMKDFFLRRHGSTFASDRVRVVANVLNFGDGMIDQNETPLFGADYVGHGDSTYGAGRVHARLFTAAGMDAPWFQNTIVIPEVQTGVTYSMNLNAEPGAQGNPIPSAASLLKIFVYWDKPFYNNYPAEIEATVKRTISTNCAGVYFPIASQNSLGTDPDEYTKGNWLHFIGDNSVTGLHQNFSNFVTNRCYKIEITGVSVPNGSGGAGTRRVAVAWFWEANDRADADGPCRHGAASCAPNDPTYLYYREESGR